ncbi:MAG: type I glyceraldehyde-3-phosphate dehydrogenase [Candidatus Daviesbacteria bacterium]|nr:type I glyceraldehyde-3-phosphate dehydrogenase [Candidatus Daviesbacteria bacterium]
MIKVAINGFGRIGRTVFKIILEKYSEQIEIIAINDLTEGKVLAHLLQHDSAYGRWGKEVFADDQNIIIDNKKYPITAEKIPANLPWSSLGIDVVLECTGRFTKEEDLQQHILAGAKKVILSAPSKGGNVATFLMGVNQDQYTDQQLINNASCTTNCVAPVAAIIHGKFGIAKALMTTTHAITAEQNLVDGPPPGGKSNDLRRARAAYSNIIPTTTGAAISTTEVIPELKGLFDGVGIRVPVILGSICDFTFLLKTKTSVDEINQAIKEACDDSRWRGIVTWSDEPLVSSDIIGRSESAIVDLSLTQVVDGDLVKVFAWYDNEFGYSNRLVEQVLNISTK